MIFPLIVIFIFASCEKKVTTIKSISPDGAIEIEINGVKSSIASPWMLTINAKKDGQVSSVETEMYTEKPGVDNILFDWASNTRCTITIIEQDGTRRTVPVVME